MSKRFDKVKKKKRGNPFKRGIAGSISSSLIVSSIPPVPISAKEEILTSEITEGEVTELPTEELSNSHSAGINTILEDIKAEDIISDDSTEIEDTIQTEKGEILCYDK